jgi:hypothetical protein
MKQSFFLTLALSLLLSATISRATILPIAKGDGIWNVATRIASELATITLDTPSCSFPIHQSDIGFGGTFVITASNTTYCLDENITITFGSAIRIAGSGITLDLSGKIIDGQNFATTGIELAGGVQNVTIKNGIIRRMGGAAPNGTAIRDTVGITRTLKNIVIKDMNFSNNSVAAISLNKATSPTPDVDEVLIENCRAFNSGNINIVGNAGVVQGCEVDERRGGAIVGGIQVSGPSASIARSFLIQDCIATSSFGSNNISLAIQRTYDAAIRNCNVEGANSAILLAGGIFVSFCKNVSIADCVVQGGPSIGIGILVNNPLAQGTVLIERCVTSNYFRGIEVYTDIAQVFSSVKLIDCFAEYNVQWGIVIPQISTTTQWSDILIKRCSATANGSVGFLIDIEGVATSFSQVIIEDCIAQDNGSDGFSLQNLSIFNGILSNVVFRNCISQRNRSGTSVGVLYNGDGFGIGTGSLSKGAIRDVIFEDCIAQGNAGDGFSFASTTSNIETINCFSMNNTNTGFHLSGNKNYAIGCMAVGNKFDFVGVSDPTQVIPYSTPGAINGIGRFVNVSS